MPEVTAIEKTVFTQPWSEGLYLSELSMPETRLYLVAIDDGSVIGYIGAMLVAGEAHVTTLAVAIDYQGKSIGKVLLYHALKGAIDRGVESATLEVRVSNQGAQALYHQFGFVPAGIRKNYYTDVNEDGLVMWSYDLASPAFALRLASIRDTLFDKGLPLPEGDSVERASQ